MKKLVLIMTLLPSFVLLAQDNEENIGIWPEDVCSLIMQGVGGYLSASDSARKTGMKKALSSWFALRLTTLPFMTQSVRIDLPSLPFSLLI